MKRITLALFVLAVFACGACSANNPTPAAATASPSAPPATMVSTAELEKQIIELEKRAWELSKNNQAEEFRKLMTPGHQAIYISGIRNLEETIQDFTVVTVKQYALADFRVNFPVKDTAILFRARFPAHNGPRHSSQ